jgi:nucleoside-diphosphate-sugar epimerase
MMARSQRMSNRKLREASGWQPALPSVREGFRATVAAMRESSSEARAA